jgi:hypothetical protein
MFPEYLSIATMYVYYRRDGGIEERRIKRKLITERNEASAQKQRGAVKEEKNNEVTSEQRRARNGC